MKVASRNLLFRKSITNGKDPSVANYFVGIDFIINPAYNATKTDVIAAYQSQSDFNTGTLTNTKSLSGGGVTLNGYVNAFNILNGFFGSWTGFGTASPSFYMKNRQLAAVTG